MRNRTQWIPTSKFKMYKLFLLFLANFALAQSQDQNYIKSTNYKEPTTTSIANPSIEQANVQINYFDGIGRPMQQIAYKQATNGKDIVTHIEYDEFGRQVKDYLPYVPTNAASLDYKSNATIDQSSFYISYNGGTSNPFSEKQFESSPLNRVLKQAAPGDSWALGTNKEIKFDYLTNILSDEVNLFKVTTSWDTTLKIYNPTLIQNGFYQINQLYKSITKDENWEISDGSKFTTEEFKNKEGQVVLKRTYNLVNSVVEKYDTYYVYDQFENLTYVLPPLASEQVTITQTVLDNLCYQYKYDYRNRLVEKKLPGKQWEFIVYDKLDRVVATGPVNTPYGGTTIGWMITEYDVFGRVTQTGWRQMTVDATTRNTNQQSINNSSNPFVLSTNDVLTKNYYDNYSFPEAPTVPTSLPESNFPLATNVKGLPTGTWTKVLDPANTATYELSYTLYDNKYRPVRSYTKNYLGGYTQVDSNIDWAGKTVYTLTKHKRIDTNTELTVKDMFSYSDQDKLLIHKQQINSDAEQLIASNTYDELGQLISKKVGGTDVSGATGLQKVDYNYNIRGWLKGINDIDDIVTENDLFAFKINYDDPETAQPLYNGNIAETLWKTGSDNKERKYNYTYDNLNRLLQADYVKDGSVSFNSYLETMTYDKNGNILTLFRNGDNDTDGLTTVNNIDNLTYTYDTNNKNQLLKVFDTSSNPQGFKDNTDGITDTTTDDYSYDANGNLIRDDNKGITLIEYNHLNLPTKITFGTNGYIEYLYNALGQKVKKMVLDPNAQSGVTTDYLTGFQYKNGFLQFFPHAEGYVNATVTIPPFGGEATYDFNYVYNYTDHLGNIRLSYSVDPASQELKIMEENHYYPFGLKHTNYNSDWLIYGRQNESTVLKKPGPIVKYEPVYKYKYNGKEYQDELGLNAYDYGARFYDPSLGKFWQLDPVAETSRRFSPYNYALDNPVYFIDRDGMYADVKNIQEETTNCCPGFPPNQAPKNTSPLGSTMKDYTPSSKTTSLFAEGKELLSNVFTYKLSAGGGYTLGVEATLGPVKVEADATIVSGSVETNETNLIEAKVEGLSGSISGSVGDAKATAVATTGSSKITVDKNLDVKTSNSGATASATATMGKEPKLKASTSGTVGLSIKIPTPQGVNGKVGVSANLYNAAKGIGKMIEGGISYLNDRVSNLFSWD